MTLELDGAPLAVTPAGPGNVTFNPDGTLASAPTISFTPGMASWPGAVDVDLAGIAQYGSGNTVTASTKGIDPIDLGFGMGSLQSFQLGNDGTITGVYSNGLRQSLGKLALASFNNRCPTSTSPRSSPA
jgi:flagellar hook protein FlgE